jgi:hypothetical protein
MDTVGYFNTSLDPLSDWELWVRACAFREEFSSL